MRNIRNTADLTLERPFSNPCQDPWDAGYMGNDTTWVSTVLHPCPTLPYSRLLKQQSPLPSSTHFLRDQSIIMIGDSCYRKMMEEVCAWPHWDLIGIDVGDRTYDPGFMGQHILCRHRLLNFTLGSFFAFALSKDMDGEEIDDHYRKGDPKVTWERVEKLLAPVLAKANITPTLIIINSGYWNMKRGEQRVNPVRVHTFTQGMHDFLIPTMKRVFPTSWLAFRSTPYAQNHRKMESAELISFYNTLMRQQGEIWGIPILDQGLVSLGMYHLYQDTLHYGTGLMRVYLDMMLYRHHDALIDAPNHKWAVSSSALADSELFTGRIIAP